MSNHTIHRKSFSGRLKKNTLKSANILQSDGKGNIISPNGTGRIVKIFTGGHTSGYEFRFQRDFEETAGLAFSRNVTKGLQSAEDVWKSQPLSDRR